MRVQLLTFQGCESAGAARAVLLRTLVSLSVGVRVEEIDLDALDTPRAMRGHGSPTVLVDGAAVGEWVASEGRACRLYRDPDGGLIGHPPESAIRAAIERAVARRAAGDASS